MVSDIGRAMGDFPQLIASPSLLDVDIEHWEPSKRDKSGAHNNSGFPMTCLPASASFEIVDSDIRPLLAVEDSGPKEWRLLEVGGSGFERPELFIKRKQLWKDF